MTSFTSSQSSSNGNSQENSEYTDLHLPIHQDHLLIPNSILISFSSPVAAMSYAAAGKAPEALYPLLLDSCWDAKLTLRFPSAAKGPKQSAEEVCVIHFHLFHFKAQQTTGQLTSITEARSSTTRGRAHRFPINLVPS